MSSPAIAYLESFEVAVHDVPDGFDAGSGLEVIGTVRDAYGLPRSGLAEALGRIARGEASTLVVPRLGSVAGSLHELVALLDWLLAAGAQLVALDVGLDTGSVASRRAVGLLREVDGWSAEPPAGRKPRGRPGIAVGAPELNGRIVAMRERGLSLQAIADQLNADGVATHRGGAQWRPSSVQAALGYRRPRSPVPGIPTRPPPRGRAPNRAPQRAPHHAPHHAPNRAPDRPRPAGPPRPRPPGGGGRL